MLSKSSFLVHPSKATNFILYKLFDVRYRGWDYPRFTLNVKVAQKWLSHTSGLAYLEPQEVCPTLCPIHQVKLMPVRDTQGATDNT